MPIKWIRYNLFFKQRIIRYMRKKEDGEKTDDTSREMAIQ